MAIRIRKQKTRVMLSGVDMSDHVAEVNISRKPGFVDTADLTFFVERFAEEDGTLVIHLTAPEGLMVRPEKRIVL